MTTDLPLDLSLAPQARPASSVPPHVQRFRAFYRAENIGPGYSGKRHFATTFGTSLAIIGLALSGVHGARLGELAAVPLTFLFANLAEYVGHRFPMHRPFPGLGLVYGRHAKQHHHFYTDEAMTFESWRDVEMVLFPALLIVFFSAAFVAPVGLLVYLLSTANAARLFVATVVGYFLLYELLHFSYHCPPDSFIGRLSLVRVLREHHTKHHDLGLMGQWNFNITFPIGDWLFGKLHRGPARHR